MMNTKRLYEIKEKIKMCDNCFKYQEEGKFKFCPDCGEELITSNRTNICDVSNGLFRILNMSKDFMAAMSSGVMNIIPILYKNEYLRRLELRIKERKEKLLSGEVTAEAYLVPGSKEFLRLLQANGIKCYLASGTDEEDVIYEAKLLGLDDAFEGGIHGAHAAMTECSKELVIRDMLEKENIKPHEMVSFGDGYVEGINLV